MNRIGFTGAPDAVGALSRRLVTEWTQRGLKIACVREATDPDFDIDTPGKDSYEHRHAGAHEVMIASSRLWALMHDDRDKQAPSDINRLDAVLASLSPADLVVIEGFCKAPLTRIAVNDLTATKDSAIAYVGDTGGNVALPRFALDETAKLADFVLSHFGLKGGAP